MFSPPGAKKVIFPKKVKLPQNHFLRLLFPEIYDFKVKTTKIHRFGGLNDARLGRYEKLPTSKIFIFEQKKIFIFSFFFGFFFIYFFFSPTILQRFSTQGVVLRPFFADIPVFEYDDHSFASQKSYRSWKKKFPKDMSKDEQCPAVRKWAQKYRFFQSCTKSLKNWL